MSEDEMTCTRNNEMLGAARGWIECRHHQRRLVLRPCTIATAEDEVILTKHNVDGSRELRRRGNDETNCKEFPECLGLLVGNLNIENWIWLVTNAHEERRRTFWVKIWPSEVRELD